MADPRLRTQLLITGLQQSNNSLYQVILALIDEIDALNAELATISGGGGTGTNTTNNYITNQLISSEMGCCNNDEMPVPVGNINNPLVINNYIFNQNCPLPFETDLDNEDIPSAPLGNINFLYVAP